MPTIEVFRSPGYGALRWWSAFWRRAEGTSGSDAWGLRLDLLRATLDEDPTHEGAAGAVRSLLPPGLELGSPFVARDWLEFVEAMRVAPIEIVAQYASSHSG